MKRNQGNHGGKRQWSWKKKKKKQKKKPGKNPKNIYWDNDAKYKEFEEKDKKRTPKDNQNMAALMMEIFKKLGQIKDQDPASQEAQDLVKQLQDFITEHFYTCTIQILFGLGQMYAAGGEFTTNIDNAGGQGTAEFVNASIQIYCK